MMKLTESHLRQIIKKELKKVLNESKSYITEQDILELAMEYSKEGTGQVSVINFAKRFLDSEDIDEDIDEVKKCLFTMIYGDEAGYWLSLEDRYGQAPETVEEVASRLVTLVDNDPEVVLKLVSSVVNLVDNEADWAANELEADIKVLEVASKFDVLMLNEADDWAYEAEVTKYELLSAR